MAGVIAFIHEWEWVLLAAVAILEISILLNSMHETRERRHLTREMETTRVELGRESYVSMKRNALLDANREVCFVSRTVNADVEQPGGYRPERLYRRGVRYRCITGTDPSKLRDMFELHQRGVEVRVSPFVILSTFRFHVWDDKGAVLGFSVEAEEDEIRGIEAMNSYFSRMLRQHFEELWVGATPWEEWAASLLLSATDSEAPNPIVELTHQWGLSEVDALELREALAAPAPGHPQRLA